MTASFDPANQPISTLVSDEVVRVARQSTMADVATVIANSAVGLVVDGDGDQVDVVVSERDVVVTAASGRDLKTIPAADVESKTVLWCAATATVGEVALEMMANYVRHVLVEDYGRLLGVVSARDLLGAYAAFQY